MKKQLFKIGKRKCHSCKIIYDLNLTNFYKCKQKQHGGFESRCILCTKKRGLLRQKNIPYSKRCEKISHFYSKYKSGAKERKLEFSISKEQFNTFFQKRCFYCNQNIQTVGLDRIDNNIGYTLENIVSCCKICNFMKRNISLNNFLKKCYEISENHKYMKYEI